MRFARVVPLRDNRGCGILAGYVRPELREPTKDIIISGGENSSTIEVGSASPGTRPC